MTGIVSCSNCVFLGVAKDKATKVCRRHAPVTQEDSSGGKYIGPARWPGVDVNHDGCGEGFSDD